MTKVDVKEDVGVDVGECPINNTNSKKAEKKVTKTTNEILRSEFKEEIGKKGLMQDGRELQEILNDDGKVDPAKGVNEVIKDTKTKPPDMELFNLEDKSLL